MTLPLFHAAPAAPQGKGYQHAARVAFAPAHSAGGNPSVPRIPFRSTLEARWALAFERLGLAWAYEPETFVMPSGAVYTPDFRIEGVGYIEIKPQAEAVMAKEGKYAEFAHFIAERGAAFYALTASSPRLTRWAGHIPPVVQWLPRGVRPLRDENALRLFASEAGRAFYAEYPEGYEGHVRRVLDETAEQVKAETLRVHEHAFIAAVAMGEDFDTLRAAYLAALDNPND